jgi:hypothetical protein
MKRIKSIFVVIAIFVSGLIVGGMLAGTAAMNKLVNDIIRDPVNLRRLLVKHAKHELRLDEDQTHQLWQILNETGTDLNKATEPVRPQIEQAITKAELRVLAVLKEHQKPEFERFMKTAKGRWEAAITGIEPAELKGDAKPEDAKGDDPKIE